MNIIKATIENVSYLGSNIYYYAIIENNDKILVIEKAGTQPPLNKNDVIFLHFSFKSCLIFIK